MNKTRIFFVALCTTFLFSARCLFSQSAAAFSLSPKAVKTLVDSLAGQITKYYVFEEKAKEMSEHLKMQCKKGVYNNINDPHILAAMLTNDVNSIHLDEHFHVEYNPGMADELLGNIDDVPKMVAERLNKAKSKNFGFKKVEILSGNIGYLEISSFSRLNEYSKATADAALKMVSNTNALIIDLRYGVGGSPEMINHIISYFFKEKIHVSDIFIRSENATLNYYTKPREEKNNLTEIPIYILSSYKTFSAAEGLMYELQSLKRATVVGETTRGGAHTVTYRALSSGFVADIPFGRAIIPMTKTNWEGTGITPDISVSADMALETAEMKIFDEALAKAKNESEKKNIQWQKDLLQSINHPLTLDEEQLSSFTGTYGAYGISYSQGTLYYQKTGKAKFLLLPLKGNIMKVKGNDSFRVEFFKDKNGIVTKIATYYDDGRVEYGERTE